MAGERFLHQTALIRHPVSHDTESLVLPLTYAIISVPVLGVPEYDRTCAGNDGNIPPLSDPELSALLITSSLPLRLVIDKLNNLVCRNPKNRSPSENGSLDDGKSQRQMHKSAAFPLVLSR